MPAEVAPFGGRGANVQTRDEKIVNLDTPEDVAYWEKKLDATEAQIRACVEKRKSHRYDDVRDCLFRSKTRG